MIQNSSAAVMLVIAGLAGCLGPEDAAVIPEPGASQEIPEVFTIEAPVLEIGTRWTFSANNLYDAQPDMSVVVASDEEGGLLFAGGAREHLVGEIMWGRMWFGLRDRSLNRVTDSPEGNEATPTYDFPLMDGKAWPRGEATVTAVETDVAYPGGTEPGFRMTVTDDGRRDFYYDHSPTAGYLTRIFSERDGQTFIDMRMTRMDTASTWFWFEPTNVHYSGGDGSGVTTVEIPQGTGSVAVSAGGVGSGRVTVLAPGSLVPWAFEGGSEERWEEAILDPVPGSWTIQVQDGADGWAYVAVAPVNWIEGKV